MSAPDIASIGKPHWLTTLDPRLKIILASLFGVLTWRVAPLGLAAYGAGALILVLDANVHKQTYRPMLGAYISFVLFWMFLKFMLDCFPFGYEPPLSPELAAINAGLLGARLAILIGIGMTLAVTSSARQLGQGLSWFLRPLLGKHSWKVALSLALMIHFLPLVQQTLAQVKQSLALRRPPRSRWQRFLLVPQATLRILGQKTWTQTVAVAARGLDRPDAWIPSFTPQPFAWIVGIVLGWAGIAALNL